MGRGMLNSPAIYAASLVATLLSALWFRSKNKFKRSEQVEYSNNFTKMDDNGINSIHLSAFLIAASCYTIIWKTFPDRIAVYNPFEKKLGVTNVDYLKAAGLFCLSYLIIYVLVKNSVHFTGPRSESFKKIKEYAKLSLSMNLLKTDSIGSTAAILPTLAFFVLIVVSYHYGNAFGVSLIYLGCICFSQIIQFFQNFDNFHYYYQAILMAGKRPEGKQIEGIGNNFSDLLDFCRFYGKYSTGVSLFIHKIMCFTILVDAFNMHIVDHINLIHPYSVLAIVTGCLAIQVFISLDHICATKFVKFFLHKLTLIKAEKINDPSWQPEIEELNSDLLSMSFVTQFFFLILPVTFCTLTYPDFRHAHTALFPLRQLDDQHSVLWRIFLASNDGLQE